MKSLRHVGIVVKDMEKALLFYAGSLGLKIKKRVEEKSEYIDTICGMKNAKLTTVKLAADDGNLVELLYFTPPTADGAVSRTLSSKGFSHISFTVSDIEAEYARLSGQGIYFNSLPQVSPDGYAKVCFCRDPEGNFIELVQVLKE